MGIIMNACSVPCNNDGILDVVHIAKSSIVAFEKPYTLHGDYEIHDAIKIFAKRNLKKCEKAVCRLQR